MEKIITNPQSVRAHGNIKETIILEDLISGKGNVRASVDFINGVEVPVFIISN